MGKSIKLLILIVGLLLIQSCSSNRYFQKDYNQYLTNERFPSKDKTFSVNIPSGWFGTKDNSKNVADLMIVKEDYSASIFINKISANQTASGLERFRNMAVSFRKANNNFRLDSLKLFDGFLDKYPYSGFSYIDKEKNSVSVYEIKKNNNIFEVTLINFEKKKKNQNLKNSVIAVLFSLD